MESAIASSSRTELASALHRLRSTLARVRAELEAAADEGVPPPGEVLVQDLREALDLLGSVEALALGVVRVLVVDDDERLGELTARGLRRLGYDAMASTRLPRLGPHELVVFDLGQLATLSPAERSALKTARPIVVTGAADPASRALALDLGASDYLVKPVEPAELAAAIQRRAQEERP